MQHFLQVEGLKKVYPAPKNKEGVTIFENIHFSLNKGEFVCIIGHSGCGKSTILNILAGLESATAGFVLIDGKEMTGPGLDRGVVFQSHALLPWLSVLDNVAFGVQARWKFWSKKQVIEHSLRYLELVGLSKAAHKKPYQLSGGMKQRVGIARAFAIEPKILLMDEPFGALDALTRGLIQDELVKICEATHQTVFMITHDVDEAILLADKIFLMSNGPRAELAEVVVNPLAHPRLRQEIYHDPSFYTVRNDLLDFLIRRAHLHKNAVKPTTEDTATNGSQSTVTAE